MSQRNRSRTNRSKSRSRSRSRTNRSRSRSRTNRSRSGTSKSDGGVERFVVGPGRYKYTAILKNGKRVNFGHRDYEHYRDSVPVAKGGGRWSKLDHGDAKRRANYRSRHGGVMTGSGNFAYRVKYSPSWFSYKYLW